MALIVEDQVSIRLGHVSTEGELIWPPEKAQRWVWPRGRSKKGLRSRYKSSSRGSDQILNRRGPPQERTPPRVYSLIQQSKLQIRHAQDAGQIGRAHV